MRRIKKVVAFLFEVGTMMFFGMSLAILLSYMIVA